MDRINSFLSKRQIKHRKVIKYRNESYEVTKGDLKLVRSYRARKCLDKTFKLSRPLDLRMSARGAEAIPLKNRPDHSALLLEKARRYYELHSLREKTSMDKNIARDVWEDDTVETLRSYSQEWVYSIKDPYDRPIEQCVFTKDDLERELRRIYLNQFRPRETKNKPIEELLPKLPDASELRPFPEEVGQVWRAEGRKYIYGRFVCSVSGSQLDVTDTEYGKKLLGVDIEGEVRQLCGDGDYLYVSTVHKILCIGIDSGVKRGENGDAGCCRVVHTSSMPIKDFCVSEGLLAVLTSKIINLYDLSMAGFAASSDGGNGGGANALPANSAACPMPATKTFVAKYENPHSVKIFNGSVYVSTANGLLIESAVQSDIKTLNYVVDFTARDGNVYVINNLNRLIVIGKDYNVKKNIMQHQMGRLVRIHPTLNLLAILFSNEIGIYKYVNGEYVPVNTLYGRYKALEWHEKMPWLYAGSSSKVELYT